MIAIVLEIARLERHQADERGLLRARRHVVRGKGLGYERDGLGGGAALSRHGGIVARCGVGGNGEELLGC